MALVSVIIPTHNRPALLPRAVRSVLAQTFQDFEIIIVDDGTESVTPVLKKFDDTRIRYIKNEGRHGGGAARNRGIKEARGEFVAFLDDDDEWLPEKLERQIQVLKEHPEAVASFSGVRALKEDGTFLYEHGIGRFGIVHPLEETLARPFIWTSALVVRRGTLLEELFDESLPKNQEWDLEIRLLTRGSFAAIPDVLVVLHVLGDDAHLGGAKNVGNIARATSALIAKHSALYTKYPKAREHVFLRLGALCASMGAFPNSRNAYWQAWQVRPSNVRALVKSFFLYRLLFPSIVRKIYHAFLHVPIVGVVAKSIANSIRAGKDPQQLFLRDLASAHNTLSALYGKDSNAHKLLDAFACSDFFTKEFSVGHSGDYDVMLLYTLTRMEKPEVSVETGVASGRSSSAILRALSENATGHLYSIDLPQHHTDEGPTLYITDEGNKELSGFVPEGKEPGWLVPDAIRSRWTLILGDSKKELPALLSRLGTIDMFYHDAEHSHEAMEREFKFAWPALREKGLLISDDVDWNSAWKEYLAERAPSYARVYRHFGVSRK